MIDVSKCSNYDQDSYFEQQKKENEEMTDKQITIDYENLCANYSKEVGCYNTFDGSCIKEQCFTYRLLQLLKAKEQECEELKHEVELMMDCASCKVDEYKQTLAEIKEIAEPFCNACQEFEPEKSKNCINCTYCNYNKILQKISEVE